MCVCVCVYACVCAQLLSPVTLCDLIDCNPPGSWSMEFSRQEYCSILQFPTPGDLPDSGIKPTSLTSPELAGLKTTLKLG